MQRIQRYFLVCSTIYFKFVVISGVIDISDLLSPLVLKHKVPALGGVGLNATGVTSLGASGVRRREATANVTKYDYWHLGSCTKAMTATMVASLVENGTTKWEDTLGERFAWLPKEYHGINFFHLFSHTSGIPPNANWKELSTSAPTLEGQRVNTVKALLNTTMVGKPGEKVVYSNWGYVVAAAMIENATGESYETLMERHVFGPLRMITAGYGPTSKSDELTQPWGHTTEDYPLQQDNPLVMSPAGTIHCSLEDWSEFVRDHLRGSLGLPALLAIESYRILHTPPFNGPYALGWVVSKVSWSKGPVLAHTGSNTYNYAFAVIAPTEGTASMSVCNKNDTFPAATDVLLHISSLPSTVLSETS